jgi:uncharacterized protein
MPGRKYDGFLPGRHTIEAYGRGGFRFAEISHQGSILALPSGIHAWNTQGPPFAEHAFDPVFAEATGIDILFIGCGAEPAVISQPLRLRFAEANLSTEALSTAAAARTFNVLLAEGRRVAAALVAVA